MQSKIHQNLDYCGWNEQLWWYFDELCGGRNAKKGPLLVEAKEALRDYGDSRNDDCQWARCGQSIGEGSIENGEENV